jgi:hypothetical protein
MAAIKGYSPHGMKILNIKSPTVKAAFKHYVATKLTDDLSERILTIINDAQMKNPLYNWNINDPNINLKARVRKFLFDNLHELVQPFYYSSALTESSGWLGGYEFPNFGCLAFVTPENDDYPEEAPFFAW